MTDRDTNALAVLAHELRTPVSTIVAAASGLERGGESLPPEKQRALVQLVASEGKRLARLVDDVVSAARLDAGELPVTLARVDIAQVTEASTAAALASAPPDRSITHSAEGDTVAMVDADRLRQVIDNLIDNALKHAAGSVQVAVSGNGKAVRVTVSDDGTGIPPGERSAIFEKFHRLESRASGSGLGLWLCRELVTRMSGTVSVDEAPSGGACFSVELPAAG